MPDPFDALQREILDALRSSGWDFESLALRIFNFQFAENPAYRTYCEALDQPPASISHWNQIPPVPSEAFKAPAPLSCHPHDQCQRVFLTSGTTAEVRGRQYLANTTLYETSIRRGWAHANLPTGLRPLFLSRPPSAQPDSSLTFMFETLAAGAGDRSWLLTEDGQIEVAPLRDALASGDPILLFSTALALRHLFERVPDRLPLPPSSWVFQTGGYKGLAETFAPDLLYRSIEDRLEVPAEGIINEYGMTELSTPSYSVGVGGPHRCPPWLKVRTIHHESNLPNPPGQLGHLVFCDLANLNSVMAVRTRDLGVALDDHSFRLEGRDPIAAPRGCSRASDAFLQRP